MTADRWPDLEGLFESRGGPKYCWCMVWRRLPKGADRRDSRGKKAALEGRVRDGAPVGILGYLDGDPVAWCSVAPRATYRDLGGPRDPPERVWSLVCMFARRRLRGQGISNRLIRAAIGYARDSGASVVEAYPVDPDSPSYRFMGLKPSFEALGFRSAGMAGTRRHVMRLPLAEWEAGGGGEAAAR